MGKILFALFLLVTVLTVHWLERVANSVTSEGYICVKGAQ